MIWSPAAERLMQCTDRVCITEGPADTGKSRAWFEKIHACCELYDGCRWLYVRQTRASCTESGLVTFEKKVLPAGSYLLDGPDRNHRQRYNYRNGSELVVGGLDNPEKLFSTEYDGVFVQEANEVQEEDTFAAFMRCLRNGKMPFHQLGADLNPTHELFWLYDWEVDGRATFIPFTHTDNPSITPERIANLASLRGVLRDRLYLGKRVAAVEGAYYGQLLYEARCDKPSRIGQYPYNPELRVHMAMDIGVDDETAIWWYQVDSKGRYYWIDYMEHRGEGMGYYAMVMDDRKAERRFGYGVLNMPHDADHRLPGETTATPADSFRKRGYTVNIVPGEPEKRIEAVRLALPVSHFDAERCKLGLQRLATYHQDKNVKTGAYGKPVHDKSSHTADSFGYGVMGHNQEQQPRRSQRVTTQQVNAGGW